ncbi:protein lethal(2)denticleless [Cylas formicarius]|uniref:protein lethal(2)denticleless n=1 Tax=Cylas formicarius TaxID=197179 RepID=UPI002958323B|nr:protein lethal(2)denticleless [Cylas formicarius]
MSCNSVKAFFKQQYGFTPWKESDTLMYRLRCKPQNAFTQLLSTADDEEYFRDTPIFACKSATQEGYEHFVALANEDGKLAVHDCETRARYGTTAHNNAIFDLSWMFDQMKIVTASGDHTSRLYDFGEGEIRQERIFCGHSRSVKTVSFRKDDSSVFASGSRDGNIILWDTRTTQNSLIGKADITIINSHLGSATPSKLKKKNVPTNSGIKSVTGLVFQDQNTLISCGAGDGVIKVWDLRKHYVSAKRESTPKLVIPYAGSSAKNGFSNLVIDATGMKLYANCLDNNIYCYNVANCNYELIMRYSGHQNSTFYIKSALCKQGNYLVSGSSDESAYLWNTKYPTPVVKLSGHCAEVTCVAWCCGKLNPSLITCSDDMTHRIWTVDHEENSHEANRGRAEILSVKLAVSSHRKRALPPYCHENTPKKLISQCRNCKTATFKDVLCENCLSTSSLKRKASDDVEDESVGHKFKRSNVGALSKRLFGHSICNNRALDDESINLKSLDTALDSFGTAPCSPTLNLPNYVIDGAAPHLNYSPAKQKSPDWLTKIRKERHLRQEMLDRTVGPSSPKIPRLETFARGKRSSTTPKSPLLRFFKMTTSTGRCDTALRSPKTQDFGSLAYRLSQ